MLSLVDGSGSRHDSSSEASPIGLEENNSVLEKLFRMISGMEVPRWDSLEEMEEVLYAAEKYDTPGPASIIRSALTKPRFLADPLRLYAIAARYQWEEELQQAAEACLAISIHEEEHLPNLMRIPTDDLLRLIDLRRQRRDAFANNIDTAELFNGGNSASACRGCGKTVDHHAWHALKHAMYVEMDKRPIGTILRNMDGMDWTVAERCWASQCGGCQTMVHSRVDTMKGIRACVDRLPMRLRPRI